MRKIVFLLMFVTSVTFGQGTAKTDAALVTQGNQIKNETTPGANTANRIGTAFNDWNYSKQSRLDSYAVSGTNTYTVSVAWVTAYTSGMNIQSLVFTNANTGSATLNVNGLGAVNIYMNGSSVSSSQICAGCVYDAFYDGTNFQLKGGGGGAQSLSAGHIFVGNVSNIATDVALSGDGTLSSSGALTVTKLNNTSLSGLSTGLLKNTTGTGVPSIAVSGTDYELPLTFSSPLSRSTNTISIPSASGSVNGYLSSTDWTTFNNKQSAITFGTGVQTALGVNVGSAGAFTTFNGAHGTPSSITLTNGTGLPPTTGISGWPANASGVLTNNGSGTLSWGSSGGLTIGTTSITSGTTGRLLYDNAGTLGEYSTVPVANGGTNISSYTTGDLLYASGSTTLSKLGIGTSLQLLRTNSGATAPEWYTPTNDPGSAVGDIPYVSSTGTPNTYARLPIGSEGQIITSLSGLPGYANNTGGWTVLRVQTSDATTTGQSLIDITGLASGTLSNSTMYEIEVVLQITTSAVTTGQEFGIATGGSGTASVVNAILTGTTTSAAAGSETINTASTATTAYNTTSGATGTIIIKGYVTTRGSGTATISIQHLKVTSGTSTVKVGSMFKYRIAQ